jgi:membrane-bound ClpP family serine protease
MAGMYLVFVLAVFIPFPRGYFLQALGTALLLAVFSFFNGTILLGAFIAVILGMICAKWFLAICRRKTGLSEKKTKRIKLTFCLGLAALGILLLVPIYHLAGSFNSPKEQIWEVDTDGNGKADKWVHHDRYDNLREIDYDMDGDGKADIFEYYDKRGNLKQRTKENLKK